MNILNEENKVDEPTTIDESAYECHICLEVASEPVLTPCGHLFWYQYINKIAGLVFIMYKFV